MAPLNVVNTGQVNVSVIIHSCSPINADFAKERGFWGLIYCIFMVYSLEL